ncbi:hypothetical protein ACHAWF_009633 [Thalassiosira exigua]
MVMEPLLSALEDDHPLPPVQPLANAAIVAVLAYLVPLLTMEINYFRLAAYRSWRRGNGKGRGGRAAATGIPTGASSGGADGGDAEADDDDTNDDEKKGDGEGASHEHEDLVAPTDAADDDASSSSSGSSAVGHLVGDVAHALHETVRPGAREGGRGSRSIDPALQGAYDAIRRASTQAISLSLAGYSLTAAGVGWSTRGLDSKVIAIVVGASQFLAALMAFIVSAKVPQWIGVYHEGSIRFVKCSSNYSEKFQRVDLHDEDVLRQLRSAVRFGVWFHFAKFYIILMPFYCGVHAGTLPISMLGGIVIGFVLMWAVFVVHEKYIRHRNLVSIATILTLSIISSLLFVRGMAWSQAVWKLHILSDEDALMVISFFSWLGLLVLVHLLFIRHTLRTEKRDNVAKSEEDLGGVDGLGESVHSTKKVLMRRNSSYSSFVFDPRTHFVDGKQCQFSEHPDLEHDFSNDSTDLIPMSDGPPIMSIDAAPLSIEGGAELFVETPSVVDDAVSNVVAKIDTSEGGGDLPHPNAEGDTLSSAADTPQRERKRRHPKWCEVCVCFSPEYQQSSCIWKVICWFKILVMALSYFLCLYFVAVSIGATYQIDSTKAGLPAVHEALYDTMNEGPVCAFDNRGRDSNITTFENWEAAHRADFKVLHCGACGACSTWDNLIAEWFTRDNMAALANECAKEALFGGGDDALTACLMKPEIGFGLECAVCWQVDILCTKAHCAFIFLQSQVCDEVVD